MQLLNGVYSYKMACSLSGVARSFGTARRVRLVVTLGRFYTSSIQETDAVTHTGQTFEPDDYRRARFIASPKLVNEQFAVKLVEEQPVVVCKQRVVVSDGGGPLGHPRVFINLDPPEVHTCGYSGRRFVLQKYYSERTMGPSITYEQYLNEIGHSD